MESRYIHTCIHTRRDGTGLAVHVRLVVYAACVLWYVGRLVYVGLLYVPICLPTYTRACLPAYLSTILAVPHLRERGVGVTVGSTKERKKNPEQARFWEVRGGCVKGILQFFNLRTWKMLLHIHTPILHRTCMTYM